MKAKQPTLVCAALAAAIMTASRPASAQQTTGEPCSANATTTVDPKYVPPPPPNFGGEINMDAKIPSRIGRRASCRPRALQTSC